MMSESQCRIAQFSDLHLTSSDGGLLKGIDCWAQLHKMLDHLERQPPVHGLVITGDVAHDETKETYERLHLALRERTIPFWLVPGNHDDPGLMREVFTHQLVDGLDSMSFRAVVENVLILGLDTHEPGSDGGNIRQETMAWFFGECSGKPEGPILVFMHHPPLDTGDDFFDTIGLRDRVSFFEKTKGYPQIRGIGFGHLHRSLPLHEEPWVQGAPSSAFGMKKNVAGWERRTEEAGYLIWSVDTQNVKTEVLGLD